jgi:hypothetical protein
MSGWTIGLIAGAVVIVAVGGLCAFVLRALQATAETTQELARALEQVQANTAALGRLDQAASSIQEMSRGLSATLDASRDTGRDASLDTGRDAGRREGGGRARKRS